MPEPSICQYCGGDQDRRGLCARCDGEKSEPSTGRAGWTWRRALIVAAGLLGIAVATAIVAE